MTPSFLPVPPAPATAPTPERRRRRRTAPAHAHLAAKIVSIAADRRATGQASRPAGIPHHFQSMTFGFRDNGVLHDTFWNSP